MVKNWLPTQTAEKISISGPDYQSAILAHVDANNLPQNLGGKCTCDEAAHADACGKQPLCEVSDAGPWSPAFAELRTMGECK